MWPRRSKTDVKADEEMPSGRYIRRVLVAVAILLAVILLLIILWQAVDVLLLFFGSILFSLFLRGLSEPLSEHTPLSQRWALAVVVLLLLGIFGGGMWVLGPEIALQVEELSQTVPESVDQLTQSLEQSSWGRFLLAQAPRPIEGGGGGGFFAQLTGFVSLTFGAIANLLILLVVGFYLALEPALYKRGLLQLVPPTRRERAARVLHVVGHSLKGWILGQMFSMIIVGILTTLGLWLLGIPLALLLGLFAALMEFIPNFGPVLASVPSLLLALGQSPSQALYVLLLYGVIQLTESYFIQPLAMRKAVDLPPVITIVGQVLLGVLLGSIGLIFAAPLVAALIVLVKMLYVEDVLGEPVELPGHHGTLEKPRPGDIVPT